MPFETPKEHMPVCSSEFMHEILRFVSLEQVKEWFKHIQIIDDVIHPILEQHIDEIVKGGSKLSTEHIEMCKRALVDKQINTDYNFENIECFHGYIFYTNPDAGALMRLSNNPDAYYGIARTSSIGYPHLHRESDAFNLILAGEGVFTGTTDDEGKFKHHYHGLSLKPGVELEIEIGMTHGHLVKRGGVLWFFAIQGCGFGKGKKCEGDFVKSSEYDTTQFGLDYI